MKLNKHKPEGKVRSYTLWLSANDTYVWAHRPGSSWPCSSLSSHRCIVYVDGNGLFDMTIDGKDIDNHDVPGDELEAIVADHIPDDCKSLWPCWN